jgi:hypothetical protein
MPFITAGITEAIMATTIITKSVLGMLDLVVFFENMNQMGEDDSKTTNKTAFIIESVISNPNSALSKTTGNNMTVIEVAGANTTLFILSLKKAEHIR